MNAHLRSLLFILLSCAFITACGPSQAEISASASQAADKTYTAQTALAPTSTSTPLPTSTASPIPPTATSLPTVTPNLAATATAVTRQAEYTATSVAASATQQAEDASWAQLVKDGAVTYTQGELTAMEDLEDNWAQRLWYRYYTFELDMSNFVIMTHVEWKYPDDANLGGGGCGFVFRLKDKDNHLYLIISARSRTFIGLMTPRGVAGQKVLWEDPALLKYSSVLPPTTGSADLWLVVEKDFVTSYVNGNKVARYYVAATNSGDIGYTILSATNNEPGTYCKFTNTRIWELVKK